MVKKRIPKEIIKEIDRYVDILKKDKISIAGVFLYGSYAKGTQHKWSDIDVCVVSKNFHDPYKAMRYLWMKRPKDSGLTIEPVGFSPKDFSEDSSLIAEIKKTGIRIR